jgi:putative endonuclease
VGITNSLERRMWEHRTGAKQGFSFKYGLNTLVYFEEFRDVSHAIRREKQLKGWMRWKKISLIEAHNPQWRDLSRAWFDPSTSEPPLPPPAA